MGDDPSFADFLQRIRGGDDRAAEELVRRFEPVLRVEIKLRMADPKLRRLLDPADICQSVLGSFFARAALGQFDLDGPDQLKGLLMTMARNKVAAQARKQRTLRRDTRREKAVGDGEVDLPTNDPSPSRLIAGREILEQFLSRLTDEERRLADLRAKGQTWIEIAAQLGGTPEARCKQLARATDRAARELSLAEVGDG
jgi:RNA polymerase sigma factor (sigma-70 family)